MSLTWAKLVSQHLLQSLRKTHKKKSHKKQRTAELHRYLHLNGGLLAPCPGCYDCPSRNPAGGSRRRASLWKSTRKGRKFEQSQTLNSDRTEPGLELGWPSTGSIRMNIEQRSEPHASECVERLARTEGKVTSSSWYSNSGGVMLRDRNWGCCCGAEEAWMNTVTLKERSWRVFIKFDWVFVCRLISAPWNINMCQNALWGSILVTVQDNLDTYMQTVIKNVFLKGLFEFSENRKSMG